MFTFDGDDGEDIKDAGDSVSDVGVDVHVNMDVTDVETGPEYDDECQDALEEAPDESEQRDGVLVSVIDGKDGTRFLVLPLVIV